MKKLVASILLVVALPAFPMSRSHKVTFKNDTSCPLVLTLEAYHAVNFDGTRPEQFTQDLSEGIELLTVASRESETFRFSDSGGGYWIRWQTQENSCISSSGVIDLTKGDDQVRIGFDPAK